MSSPDPDTRADSHAECAPHADAEEQRDDASGIRHDQPGWLIAHPWVAPLAFAGLFIAVLATLISIISANALATERSDLETHASSARQSIHRRLEADRQYLALVADELAGSVPTRKEFVDRGRVETYLGNHPELIHIKFVDTDNEVAWIASTTSPSTAYRESINQPDALRAIENARRNRKPAYRPPFLTIDGDTAIEVFVPVFQGETFLGNFVGTYSCDRLLRDALPRETFQKHRVRMLDGRGNIIVASPATAAVDERLTQIVRLDPPGNGLALSIERYGGGMWGWRFTGLIIICIGLVAGMAIGMWSLNRQVARRAAAEADLRRARDQLEERVRERTADLEDEITHRKEAEQQLLQHQEQLARVARLSTLGEMAAGLAHELHQPLGAIASFADGSKMMLDSGDANGNDEAIKHALSEMSAQAKRAGKIIHRLRTFVSDRDSPRTVEAMHELVAQVLDLIKVEARQHGVQIDCDVSEDLPAVSVDAIQIQQLLVNVLRNAIEAMHDTPEAEHRITITATPGNEQTLRVAVTDTGPGCDPNAIEKIFDSFYTTKQSGMGMGLSICRTIIETHGGELTAEHLPGGGFAVRFTLPVVPLEKSQT